MRFSAAKVVPPPPYTPPGAIESSREIRPSRTLRSFFNRLPPVLRATASQKRGFDKLVDEGASALTTAPCPRRIRRRVRLKAQERLRPSRTLQGFSTVCHPFYGRLWFAHCGESPSAGAEAFCPFSPQRVLENAESPSLQVQPAMNRENRRAERSKATRGDCILYFFHVRFDLAHGFLRRAVVVRDAVGKGRVERRARVIHRVKIAR